MSGAQLINTTINVPLITNKLTGTGERDTGYTYDGKTVYTKDYTGTASATNGALVLDTITGLSHIVRFYGWWENPNVSYYPFNRVEAGSSTSEIFVRRNSSNIELYSASNYNSFPFHISVFYTK